MHRFFEKNLRGTAYKALLALANRALRTEADLVFEITLPFRGGTKLMSERNQGNRGGGGIV